MYKSLTTDPRWTTLCTCACVFKKKNRNILKYNVAEIFVAIKVTVLEIKI